MSTSIELSKIVEAMDMQSIEGSSYLDKNTGEVIVLAEEELRAAEDGDSLEDYPQWQRENIRMAQKIIDDCNKRFLGLSTEFDINEYQIMERFCLSLSDRKISDALYHTIKGSGAFRRFKDNIHRFGIADDWYKYKDRVLKKIAVEWCEENDIEYVDDLKDRHREVYP